MASDTTRSAPGDFSQNWLLDGLADGILLLDPEWNVLFANRAAEAILNVQREDVLGAAVPEDLFAVYPGWKKILREVTATREMRSLPEAPFHSSKVNGRVFAGEVQPSPLGGVAVVFRDITEQKQREEVLRLRDRAIAASSNGIIITDAQRPEHPIIYVNPAFEQITGYSAEEALGSNCRFLQRDDRDQPELDDLREAVREGRSCSAVLRNYRKDGTLFWNELHISPVLDEAGNLTHFVGIQLDITEDKRAEEELLESHAELEAARDELEQNVAELAEATQAKDRFMATMSHEMRTPLNAVLGYVELLDMGLSGELTDPQRGQLERIRLSAKQLLDLVNDVLDLARAEAGRLEIDLQPIDLRAVVEEAITLLEPQAEAKGITLSVEFSQSCPPVHADLRRVRQIVTNLVSNAVKFTEHGTVAIRCEEDQATMKVAVQDTGIGIAPQDLPNVFKEFYQADSDLTRAYGGTGLGLAIAQRLARLMGGEISVESQLGGGSTFTVTLPISPEEQERSSGAEGLHQEAGADASGVLGDENTPPYEGQHPVVVVFGENREALAQLASRLSPAVRVFGVTNPHQVAEVALRQGASLVVLDVACMGGAGWHAAHELRAEAELEDAAVLLLPCLPDKMDGALGGALDLGAVAVVPKPFTSDRLVSEVERAVGEDGFAQHDGGKRDVLVVDDDPDARRIASKILSAAGASVREAPDGETGLAEMRRQPPAIAVLDLMMPVLDGFGVLAAMRADPALRDIPVVVLTAKDLSEKEREFLARTAERVLQKGAHRLADVATLILRAAGRGASAEGNGGGSPDLAS